MTSIEEAVSDASSDMSFTTIATGLSESPLALAAKVGKDLRPLLTARLKSNSALQPIAQADSASTVSDYPASSIISPDDSVSRIGVRPLSIRHPKGRVALSSLSAQDVAQLMHAIDLGCYAGRVISVPLRGIDLQEADDSDLEDAGIGTPVHRRALLRQVATWRTEGVPEQCVRSTLPAQSLDDATTPLIDDPTVGNQPAFLTAAEIDLQRSTTPAKLGPRSAWDAPFLLHTGCSPGPSPVDDSIDAKQYFQTGNCLAGAATLGSPPHNSILGHTTLLLREAERLRATRRSEVATAKQVADSELTQRTDAHLYRQATRHERLAAVLLQAAGRGLLVRRAQRGTATHSVIMDNLQVLMQVAFLADVAAATYTAATHRAAALMANFWSRNASTTITKRRASRCALVIFVSALLLVACTGGSAPIAGAEARKLRTSSLATSLGNTFKAPSANELPVNIEHRAMSERTTHPWPKTCRSVRIRVGARFGQGLEAILNMLRRQRGHGHNPITFKRRLRIARLLPWLI